MYLLVDPVGNRNRIVDGTLTIRIGVAAVARVRVRMTSHLGAETRSATKSKSLVLAEYLIWRIGTYLDTQCQWILIYSRSERSRWTRWKLFMDSDFRSLRLQVIDGLGRHPSGQPALTPGLMPSRQGLVRNTEEVVK